MIQLLQFRAWIKTNLWVFYSISSIFLLLIIPIWIFLIAPHLKKIPDNFSYTAGILSLDNFYDPNIKKFEGEHISKTMFSYNVVIKTPLYLVIKNSFTVSTLSDKPIFSVSRLYYIDPYTGRHITNPDARERSGYLFAPRYANKKDFEYWHINYDAPALMKFIDKQKIDNLTTYHYQAQYHADQTDNLHYLPGVPEKRGVKTNINLQLWIEPISGWLVKYQDDTLAYFYDIKTNKTLEPWNQFSNRYTQTSIARQVNMAIKLKWEILIIDFGIPLLLGIFSIYLLYVGYMKKKNKTWKLFPKINLPRKQSLFSYIVYSLIIIMAGEFVYLFFLYKKTTATYTIGISQWDNNPELINAVKGFKDGLAEYGFQEGKNVKFIIKNPNATIEKQIEIIQSFVHDKVNLIFTLTTPGTLVAKGVTRRIPIVFSDVMYPEQTGIIEAVSSPKSNLVGTQNYISPAQQFFKFDTIFPKTKSLCFIHHKEDPDSDIQRQEYETILKKRDIAVVDVAAVDIDDLTKQLEIHKGECNALFIACDTLIRGDGGKIAAQFSKKYKIPSLSCDKESILNGGLIGYLSDLYSIGKLAGNKAALILQGAAPSWLHTEPLKKGYLIINLPTAKLLQIEIPTEFVKQADTVVDH